MSILIRGGTVFNGIEVLGKQDVVVEEGVIKAVGEHNVHADIEVDARDMFVMPGMVDAHFHFGGSKGGDLVRGTLAEDSKVRLLRATTWASKIVEAGVTTVRDCGEANAIPLRQAVNEGWVKGPRILAAGRPLSQTFGHGEFLHTVPVEWNEYFGFAEICDGREGCIRGARRVLREGSDFIKIMATGGVLSQRDKPEWPQFTHEEISAIVHEAEKVGTYVAAHAHGDNGARIAVESGVRSIEHGSLLSEDTLRLMAERDVVLVPTLSIQELIHKHGKQIGVNEWGLEKIASVRENIPRVLGVARRLGITILTGTDIGFESGLEIDVGRNFMEPILLVEVGGLTNLESLRATTSNAGKLGLKTGVIDRGRPADIVVIDGDPTTQIRDLAKAKWVIKAGKVVKGD
ncbi:MAG: amidohydrolase family protein [Thermoprotei archaeon]